MRTKTFRPCDQHSLLLMPPSLHDWVDPAGLPAFVSDLVDELDLAPFLAAHDEPRGMPPYHPAAALGRMARDPAFRAEREIAAEHFVTRFCAAFGNESADITAAAVRAVADRRESLDASLLS